MLIVAANLLSLLILLLFAHSRWRATHSWLEPGIVFAANLILLYPVRGLTILFLGEPIYPAAAEPKNLLFVSSLAVIGCLGFVVGYLAVIRRHPLAVLEKAREPVHPDDMAVCVAFFVVSLAGIAYQIATGDYMSYLISENRIEGLTQIGTLLAGLQWPAFIAAWVLWFRGLRTPSFVGLFVVIQVVVIPYQFLQGSKTFLSLLLVSVIAAFYWSRRRVPRIAALTAVAVVVLFVFPFVQGFRNFVNTEYGVIPSLSALDLRALTAVTDDEQADSGTALDRGLAISARYGGMDELYSMTQLVPGQLSYRYGTEYGLVLLNVVPRMVWPSKPSISRAATYGASLGTITAVTPFPFGEAYWDMGVSGVLLSMFVWGACLAGLTRMYSWFYELPGLSFFVGTYFLSQIYWIAGGETSMPAVISMLPQQAVILLCLYHGLRALGRLTPGRGNWAVGMRPRTWRSHSPGSAESLGGQAL